MRREAVAAMAYAAVYIAYLFVHPENEFMHWLSLVAVPIGGLASWRRRYAALDRHELLASVGLGRRPSGRGLVAAVVAGGAISALQLFGRNAAAAREIFTSGRAVWALPASFALMVLTAATTEEFFFRGVLQTRWAALLPFRGGAIAVAALVFAIYHIPYAYATAGWGTHGDLAAATRAALGTGLPMGLLLGAVFSLGRGSLVSSILAHALINTIPGMLIVTRWWGH